MKWIGGLKRFSGMGVLTGFDVLVGSLVGAFVVASSGDIGCDGLHFCS